MKLKRVFLMFLVLIFTVSTLLVGCDTSRDSDKNDDKGEKNSKVVINLAAEPPELDSTVTTDTTSFTVLRHAMEGLIRLDENNEVIPGVAESWEISEDGLTYTFKLRDDSKWSNGDKVTANDFEFAFKTLLSPETASEYAYILTMIDKADDYNQDKAKADEVGVKAVDESTLEIKLNSPTPYFLSVMSFGVCMPVNEKFYQKNESKYGSAADKLVYNGPWIMKEWKHEDRIVLEKNPDYWNSDEIKIDTIEMLMMEDINAAFNKFLAGEIDMTNIEPEKVEKAEEKGYEVGMYGDGATAYTLYNFKDELLKNQKIRKALSLAIDRESLTKYIHKGVYLPAYSYTSPTIKGEKSDSFAEEVGEILEKYDKDKAKKLWDEGLKELGMDKAPELEIIVGDSPIAKKDGQAIQEYIKKALDINVKILSISFKDRLEKTKKGEFQLVEALWGPDYNDPMTFLDMFVTGGGMNQGYFESKEYDKLVKDAKVESDPSKRFQMFKDMEKIIAEELPVAPLYFRQRVFLQSEELTGLVRTNFQDINLYYAEMK
ncbi:MAG: peptide ABC transporter substrate-binding protein [Clostridiales bacterium]